MALEQYKAKRDFSKTAEPKARVAKHKGSPIFVIQEHHARRLHFDFRLEADGVLKSWAVPKEPTLDPTQKRLAVQVEDHPLDYASFKGRIPEGEYGAGTVDIWDKGTYDNLLADKPEPKSVSEGIRDGRVEIELNGRKLHGRFALIRMRRPVQKGKDNWLLIKMKDEFAQRSAVSGNGKPRPARAPKTAQAARVTKRGKVTGEPFTITNPDKILFPESGITKGQVLDFYYRISDRLLPHLKDRPVTLERLPDGLGPRKPHFWQKNTPSYYPEWIPRVKLISETGKPVQYALVNDVETLLYLVNQGTLTFHVWFSRVEDLDLPDFVLFDLDPGQAPFAHVVKIARQLHELLTGEGQQAQVKTSGKTGLHVLVRWDQEGGYGESRRWAEQIARRAVEALPEIATTERSRANRQGRVYVDVMQNARGHHAVPPYVLRAVPAATVSTPLEWRELTAKLDPKRFNIKTIFRRTKVADPLQSRG